MGTFNNQFLHSTKVKSPDFRTNAKKQENHIHNTQKLAA